MGEELEENARKGLDSARHELSVTRRRKICKIANNRRHPLGTVPRTVSPHLLLLQKVDQQDDHHHPVKKKMMMIPTVTTTTTAVRKMTIINFLPWNRDYDKSSVCLTT